ncbi:MAG: shikimate dehydrogenase [Pirellulaceae bacterium]|nr:shikimate dehydrogenase [Pirellulaceae bacterium]
MICVTIGRGRHQHMIAEHKALVEQGAKLVELRLDYISRNVDLSRLLKDRPGPVVVTCRRREDGGRWRGTEEARQMLLRVAIASGAEYVDLEEDIAEKLPRFGSTKRIVSYHNFQETPEDLDALHARLAMANADIVKIATMANSVDDNLRVLKLIKESTIPTIGLCMGEIGTPTRILNAKFGSPFTYAAFQADREFAPGQISYAEMKKVYHYEKINAETEFYGVIADPVGHSLSPIVHNTAFQHDGLNKVYLPFRVVREDLESFLESCPEFGVKGLSVTIPHKESVLPKIDHQDPSVEEVQSVNTILFTKSGLYGYNTDFQAALVCLAKGVGAEEIEGAFEGKTALVLGAGGVSKTIANGLHHNGAKVVVTARTDERAERLAGTLGCRVVKWEKRQEIIPDILVNGTPVGMHPNLDETPFDIEHLPPTAVVFDTVYNPERTLLLKQAREANLTAISGAEMFIRQAAMQYRLFTGKKAPKDIMYRVFKSSISAAKYEESGT